MPTVQEGQEANAATKPAHEQVPYLSQANAVGQGFNIFGALLDDASRTRPLLNFTGTPTKVVRLMGEDYAIPEVISAVFDSRSNTYEDVVETREDFQNKIAAEVGVSAGYGAFKGEFDLRYSSDSGKNTSTMYGFRKSYSQIAELQLLDEALPSCVEPAFTAAVKKLPDDTSDDAAESFIEFFRDYGAYYISSIVLGGVLEFHVSVENSEQWRTDDIRAKMDAEWDGAMITGKLNAQFEKNDSWKKYQSSRRKGIQAIGGDPAKAKQMQDVDPASPSANTVGLSQSWAASVDSSPSIVRYGLRGIWELCGDKRKVVQAAFQKFSGRIKPHVTIQTTSQLVSLTKTGAYGNGGDTFDEKSAMPVRSWHIYWDGDKVVGFKWTYFGSDEQHSLQDVSDKQKNAEFVFEPGETFTKFTIFIHPGYGGGWGAWYGLEFDTSRGRHWGTQPYDAYKIDSEVAGRCLMGFHGGTHGSGSDNPHVPSIGLWLSPPVSSWPAQAAEPPLVMVAGRPIKPQEAPKGPCGFHVIITNGRNHPGAPSAIRLNRYYAMPNVPVWQYAQHLVQLYDGMVNDIEGQQLNNDPDNLLIVASFGMDFHLRPTEKAVALLKTAGAGKQLTEWCEKVRKGPLPDWGEGSLCNYMLVGYFCSDPGAGSEQFKLGRSAELKTYLEPDEHVARAG